MKGVHGDTGLASKMGLAAVGLQDTYIAGNKHPTMPEFTQFTESIPYYTSTNVYAKGARFWSGSIKYTLEPMGMGDLLTSMVFSCRVPFSPYPVFRDMGNRIFDKMILSVMGREIQSVSGEYSSIYNHRRSTDYQKANITGEMTNLGVHIDESPGLVKQNLISCPVPFFFNPYKSGIPFPLCALGNNKIDIDFNLRDVSELYSVKPLTPSDDTGRDYGYEDLEFLEFDNYFDHVVIQEQDKVFAYRSSWNLARSIRIYGSLILCETHFGIGKNYYELLKSNHRVKPNYSQKYMTTTLFVNNYKKNEKGFNSDSNLGVSSIAQQYFGFSNEDRSKIYTEDDTYTTGWVSIYSTARVSVGVPAAILKQNENTDSAGMCKLVEIDLKDVKLTMGMANVTGDEKMYLRSIPYSFCTDNVVADKLEIDLNKVSHSYFLNSTLSVKSLYWYFSAIPTEGDVQTKKINNIMMGAKVFMNTGTQRLDTMHKDFFSYYMAAVEMGNNLGQVFSYSFVQDSVGTDFRGKLFKPPRKDSSAIIFSTQQTPEGSKRWSLYVGRLVDDAHFLQSVYENTVLDVNLTNFRTNHILGTLRIPYVAPYVDPFTGAVTPRSSLGIGKTYSGPPLNDGNVYYTTEWTQLYNGQWKVSLPSTSSSMGIDDSGVADISIQDQAGAAQPDTQGYVKIGSAARVSVNTPVEINLEALLNIIYLAPKVITLSNGKLDLLE